MDVFPILPEPMRAVGVRFSARPTIFSIITRGGNLTGRLDTGKI